MPKALTRPEQASYPSSVAAGHDAIALWLENPVMSLATWRDYRFSTHTCGVGLGDLIEHHQAFGEAFAQGAANAIVGMVIIAAEVSHA